MVKNTAENSPDCGGWGSGGRGTDGGGRGADGGGRGVAGPGVGRGVEAEAGVLAPARASKSGARRMPGAGRGGARWRRPGVGAGRRTRAVSEWRGWGGTRGRWPSGGAVVGGAERCGGSASWPVAARGSSVWRRRECDRGGRAVFFWLSHVSSVGYPKADVKYSYFFRRLSKADKNYNFVRRSSLADGSCCSFVDF
jgi:hypothetical protein